MIIGASNKKNNMNGSLRVRAPSDSTSVSSMIRRHDGSS